MAQEVPNWMKRFLKQDYLEEQEELRTPTKLLDTFGRSFVWWLCKQFSVMSDGVMGQACTLLERILTKQFLVYSYLPRHDSNWYQIKEDMARRVPLLTSVCISLITKMMSSERQVQAKTIHDVLRRLNFPFTLTEINEAEIEVLHKLDFTLPMFTNVEKAVMVAVDVGMTGGVLLEAVTLVTDVVEYFRSDIQKNINEAAFSKEKNKRYQHRVTTNSRHIHLVAGCVIATGLFLRFTGPNPLPRLCFLTQASRAYLKCIGDIIFNRLMIECGTVTHKPLIARKRKLE